MKRPQCVVHIGAPKTGTTFLQKLIWTHREALRQLGWLYPEVSLRGWGHHDLAFLSAGGYPEWARPQELGLEPLTAQLAQAVRQHAANVLLSSENFFLCARPEGLHALLERSGLLASHELTLVVYLREQGAAHESWYNQTIKAQGYTHGPAECVRQHLALFDYQDQLDAWSEVFGASTLHARIYDEREYEGGSLQADFTQASGVPLAELPVDEPLVNSGLNRDALEFQRLVNALPLKHEERRRFHKHLIALTARTQGQGLFHEGPILTTQQLDAIRAHYAAGNAAVARRYLGRDVLFKPVPAQAEAMPYPGLGTEALARLMGWLMIHKASS